MNTDNDTRPKFMRFIRTFAVPILLAWLLLTVALNVLVPPIESVARNHAVTMSPKDAPAMIAAKRIGATFHESDSDSIAMIVLESDEQLGDEAHRYYDGLVQKLQADPKHVQHVQNVWGDPLTAAGVQSAGIDDVRWADGDGGTLYVVDDNGGAGGNGAIYAISGPFFPGEPFAAVSETGAPNSSSVASDGQTVDTLNLASGILTPFASGFVKASGEVWVPSGGGDETGPAGPAGPPGSTGPPGVSVLVICIAFHGEVACFKHHLSGGLSAGLAVLSRAGVRYAAGRIDHGRLSLRATRAVGAGSYTLRLGARRRFALRVP